MLWLGGSGMRDCGRWQAAAASACAPQHPLYAHCLCELFIPECSSSCPGHQTFLVHRPLMTHRGAMQCMSLTAATTMAVCADDEGADNGGWPDALAVRSSAHVSPPCGMWQKVTLELPAGSYPAGTRRAVAIISGRDEPNWAGNFGARVAAPWLSFGPAPARLLQPGQLGDIIYEP